MLHKALCIGHTSILSTLDAKAAEKCLHSYGFTIPLGAQLRQLGMCSCIFAEKAVLVSGILFSMGPGKWKP